MLLCRIKKKISLIIIKYSLLSRFHFLPKLYENQGKQDLLLVKKLLKGAKPVFGNVRKIILQKNYLP